MKNELLLTKFYLHAFENLTCKHRITSYQFQSIIELFYGTEISIDKIIKALKIYQSKPVSVEKSLTRRYLITPKPIQIFIATTTWGKCRFFYQYSDNLFMRKGAFYYGEIVNTEYFKNEKILKIKKTLLTKSQ